MAFTQTADLRRGKIGKLRVAERRKLLGTQACEGGFGQAPQLAGRQVRQEAARQRFHLLRSERGNRGGGKALDGCAVEGGDLVAAELADCRAIQG